VETNKITIMGSHAIPNIEWWDFTAKNSKGHNIKMLELLKEQGAPIIEVDGELMPDEENFEWEWQTMFVTTFIKWILIPKIEAYHGN